MMSLEHLIVQKVKKMLKKIGVWQRIQEPL